MLAYQQSAVSQTVTYISGLELFSPPVRSLYSLSAETLGEFLILVRSPTGSVSAVHVPLLKLWGKTRHLDLSDGCLLYPRKRTWRLLHGLTTKSKNLPRP